MPLLRLSLDFMAARGHERTPREDRGLLFVQATKECVGSRRLLTSEVTDLCVDAFTFVWDERPWTSPTPRLRLRTSRGIAMVIRCDR
jgi:hypothetical protein